MNPLSGQDVGKGAQHYAAIFDGPNFVCRRLTGARDKKSKAEQELQLYNEVSKKKNEEVERERRERRQFVYTLRSPAADSQPPK